MPSTARPAPSAIANVGGAEDDLADGEDERPARRVLREVHPVVHAGEPGLEEPGRAPARCEDLPRPQRPDRPQVDRLVAVPRVRGVHEVVHDDRDDHGEQHERRDRPVLPRPRPPIGGVRWRVGHAVDRVRGTVAGVCGRAQPGDSWRAMAGIYPARCRDRGTRASTSSIARRMTAVAAPRRDRREVPAPAVASRTPSSSSDSRSWPTSRSSRRRRTC